MLGHKKLENTEIYTHLINFESDEWHVSTAEGLEEEKKIIEAGFEYVKENHALETVIDQHIEVYKNLIE